MFLYLIQQIAATLDQHLYLIPMIQLPPRHDPDRVRLSARVPREHHSRFYAACRERGFTGSKTLRSLMESFVCMAAAQDSHGQAT
jgi:hypothetical protein